MSVRRKGVGLRRGLFSLMVAERDRRRKLSPPVPPRWEEAVAAYIAEGRRANLSPSTLETRRDILLGGRTLDFLASHPIGSVAEIDRALLRELQLAMFADGLAPSTVATHHRRWRAFARFCASEGWLAKSSTVFDVAAPREPLRHVKVITATQEAALMAAARHERDRFLMRFLIRTGVRLSECCDLVLSDVLEDGLLLVRQGKGRKPRAVPLDTGGCKFSAEVDRYVRLVRPPSPSDALFLTLTHRRGAHPPLRPHGLYIMLARLGRQTGIHVHPHLFRHTFATRALAAGVNPLYLQRALGHTTLAMTNRYVAASQGDLVEAWSRRRD